MEKILKTFNNLVKHDKLLHSFYGNFIYTFTIVILCLFYDFNVAAVISLSIVAILAIGKEVYDYSNKDKHTPDIYDIVYTISNPLFFTLIALFFN